MTEMPDPPAWAQTLLAIMIAPADYDAVAGDLTEEFRAAKLPPLGLDRARQWYCALAAAPSQSLRAFSRAA